MLLCKNRTHNNGELTIANVGEVVELKGWCAKKRNLGSLVFIDLSNKILVESLMEIAPTHFLMDIDVLYLKLPLMIRNSLLVIIIVLISFIIPLVKLKALKPTNIIKAKE